MMTINNKRERNYGGKCLDWPVTRYDPAVHLLCVFTYTLPLPSWREKTHCVASCTSLTLHEANKTIMRVAMAERTADCNKQRSVLLYLLGQPLIFRNFTVKKTNLSLPEARLFWLHIRWFAYMSAIFNVGL